MPTYKITAPNGKTYRVDGPDGASDEDVRAEVLRQNPDAAGVPDMTPEDKPIRDRTMGEVAGDTVGQLVGGAIGMVSTPFDLLAPQLGVGQESRKILDEWQSDPMKEQLKQSAAAIKKAGEGGLWDETKEAFNQYSNPMMAGKVIASNMANMVPGAAAAKYGLKMASLVNSLMNGGGARGEAFREIYQEEVKKGATPEEAEKAALMKSVPSLAAGMGMGALSGGSGMESVISGVGKKGLKAAGKQVLKEAGGEIGEEVVPAATTNVMADKPLAEGLGETAVQALIGSTPGSAIAGVGSMVGGSPSPTGAESDAYVNSRIAGISEPDPVVESGMVDETPPPQGELDLMNIAGGGEGGGMQLGQEMEVDENGMPIDIERTLELQDTESGRTMEGRQKELWEQDDVGQVLADEAKRGRLQAFEQVEQSAAVGPQPDQSRLKQQAFEEAERADADWKKMTEDAAFKGANLEAMKQIITNGGRDTSMEAAFQKALGENELGDTLPGTQAVGDPLLFPDGQVFETPAQTFLGVLREKGAAFAQTWASVNTTLADWGKATFGPLLSENSLRGDAVRWKLLHDAAFDQRMMEEAVQNGREGIALGPQLRGDGNWGFGDKNKALHSELETSSIADQAILHAGRNAQHTGLSIAGLKDFSRTVRWSQKVLPHLTRNAESITVYSQPRAVSAYLKYLTMQKAKMPQEKINNIIAQQFPEFAILTQFMPKRDYSNTLKGLADPKTQGMMSPAPFGHTKNADASNKDPKNRAGRHFTMVFMKADTINKGSIINTVGILVHELAHARHFRRYSSMRNTDHDYALGTEYRFQWTEQKARQAEETARIKFASMYRAELNAASTPRQISAASESLLAKYSDSVEPGWEVPSSRRANTPSQRNAGAVGPNRLPVTATGYRNLTKEKYLANQQREALPTYAALEGPASQEPDPKIATIGTGVVATGDKLYPNNAFRRAMAALPTLDTTSFLNGLADISGDIGRQIGFRTGSYRGTTPTLVNPTFGDFVYAHVTQKFVTHAATEHANNAKSRSAWEALEAHYAADSIQPFGLDLGYNKPKGKRRPGAKQFAADARILLWFEEHPDQWHDGKTWYPTEAQMIVQGLSPKSAKTWRGVMDQYERLWDTLEDAVGVAGRNAVQRVPGYMPHTTMGQYSAVAFRADKTGERVQYIAEIGGRTEAEAKKSLELLKKHFAGQNLSFMVDPPQPGKYDVGTTLEGLRKARDLAGNIEGLKKLAAIIEGNAARGVITHALDRGEVAKFGHTLERAAMFGSEFGMDLEGQMEAVRGFREYVKAVNGYAERVKFVRDTLGPLDMAGALDLPNLRDAIFNNFKDYVGITNINAMDTFIKSKLVGFGLDPSMVDKWVNNAQSGLASFYLLGNVPFYVVNLVQATASFPLLWAKRAELRLQNATKLPDIGQAITKGMIRTKNLRTENTRLRDPVVRWAEEHGFLDPQAHEAMQPGVAVLPKDPLTAGIDRKTRQIAFVIGYEFYKQTMDHEGALHKAGAFSKEVAVPYEKSVGKPSVLNRLPVIGQAAALFTTYPMHILSMLDNQTKMTIAAGKEKNYKAMGEATGAMLSYVALQVGMFGLMGLPFAGFLSDSIDWLNEFMGKPALPNIPRLARMFDQATGLNGLGQFGIISKTLGYDISSSAQGVQPVLPEASWRGVTILFQALLLGGNAFIDRTTQQDVWKFASTLPSIWRGAADKLLREHPDTTAQEHFREKGLPRTKADQWLMFLAGTRSVQEKAQMTTERLLALDQTVLAARFGRIERKLKSRDMTPEIEKELRQVAEEFQLDPTPIIQGYVTWMETKDLSPDIRRAMKTNSLKGANSYQRFLKERSNEPMRAP